MSQAQSARQPYVRQPSPSDRQPSVRQLTRSVRQPSVRRPTQDWKESQVLIEMLELLAAPTPWLPTLSQLNLPICTMLKAR